LFLKNMQHTVSLATTNFKMRTLVIFLATFLLCFCKSKPNHKTLHGVWVGKSETQSLGTRVTDKLSFFKQDSFLLQIYANDKLRASSKVSYTLNEKAKLLTVKFGTVENKSTILEMTDSTLVSKPENASTVTVLKRVE
jgi:hypothetical protein